MVARAMSRPRSTSPAWPERARAAPPAMPREVTRVGAYALKHALGRGAFGWVKLAVQDETGAKAAIKVRRRARMDGWMRRRNEKKRRRRRRRRRRRTRATHRRDLDRIAETDD